MAGRPVIPMMVMGATDGRSLRAAGIPTYGVQGFFMDRDDMRFHGRDERMGVEAFYEGQTFLYQLVRDLSKTRATAATLTRDPGARPFRRRWRLRSLTVTALKGVAPLAA